MTYDHIENEAFVEPKRMKPKLELADIVSVLILKALGVAFIAYGVLVINHSKFVSWYDTNMAIGIGLFGLGFLFWSVGVLFRSTWKSISRIKTKLDKR